MTGQDIRILAQISIGKEINKTYATKFLNEGMEILAEKYDTACVKETTTITATKNTWYDLPNGFLKIRKVYKDDDEVLPDNYLVDFDQILFIEDGTYTIEYLRYPNELTVETDTPEIHKAYHKILSYFIASRETSRLFGSENPESARFMQEFEIRAKEIDIKLSSQKRRRRIKTKPFI
ncbi:MAG: hypothetical protein H0Z24_06840 [Thermosipho sp. (in: Bacteria)]|nr:hypothetical protein [Thermosipho sp. (in: thermotogales)]